MRQPYPNELMHYGIPLMKWGVRRYQNPDGSLTEAGRLRYGVSGERSREARKEKRRAEKVAKFERKKQAAVASGSAKAVSKYAKSMTDAELKSAIDRVKNQQTLEDLERKEATAKGRAQAEETLAALNNLAMATEKFEKMYTTGSKIVNGIRSAKRRRVFESDLRNKDPEYFRKHASEYSNAELKEMNSRYDELKKLKSRSKDSDSPYDSPDSTSSRADRRAAAKSARATARADSRAYRAGTKPFPTYSSPAPPTPKPVKPPEKSSWEAWRETRDAAYSHATRKRKRKS